MYVRLRKKSLIWVGAIVLLALALIMAFIFLLKIHSPEKEQYKTEKNRLSEIFAVLDSTYWKNKDTNLILIDEAIRISKRINDSIAYAKALFNKARALTRFEINDSGLIIDNTALDIAEKFHNDTLIAKIKENIGAYYYYKDNFYLATMYYSDAENIAARLKNDYLIGKSSGGLGSVYTEMDDYKNALECFERSIDKFEKLADKRYTWDFCNVLMRTGVCYMYKNDLPKAKIYQEKALEKARLIDSKELICKIYSNLGCIYQYLGDNPGALNYFLKAYNYSVQINENSKMHVILLHNIGTYYQRNNQFKLAEEYLNQSLAISSKRNYKIMEAGSIYLLSEVKKNTGQWKDAYLYYSRSREMNDSVLNFEMQRKVSDYQWEIKSQKSKFEKQLLIRQYDSQKKRNLILIIAIFSTLIITLLIMRNLKRSVRFQKMENYYLQEKIETDEKINALEKFKYQTEIESKNKELSAISFQLVTKNEILLNISDIIDKHKDDNSTNKNVYIDLKRKIKEDLNIDQGWGQFKEMFEKVHHDFFINIKAICPSLTENELRFCAFLRINLLNKEIAQMLNSSNDAIKKTRYRIRKKLNLDSKTSLEEFIRNI